MSSKFYLPNPSSIHLFSQPKPSSWLPRNHGHEQQKRHYNFTIVLSNNRLKTRVSPSSLDPADAVAAAVGKPVDISVLIQTSALLLFMYILANFVVPQIISGKFDQEEENN